jgi:hypothetical protein
LTARGALPVLVGVLAAAATFAVVAPLTAGDDLQPAGAPPAAGRSADLEAAGRIVFARMGCGNCHLLAAANAQGQIGPNLDRRLPGHTRASLAAQIVNPYAGAPPRRSRSCPRTSGSE